MKKLTTFIKNLFYPTKARAEATRLTRNLTKYNLIEDEILEAIRSQIYLEAGFNLTHLATKTGVPYHHLTAYFNYYLGITFNDWKNNLRIEYILEQFDQGRNRRLTLETLAREAGFLSRSNFVDSFKKKMGMNPSQYVNVLIYQKNVK
jgi:AraC-like DNA-binding protein